MPRSTISRCMAAAMAAVTLMQGRAATAAPADVFVVPTPALTAEPERAAELRDGDASVAIQTGALQYSYPIVAAPGRQGMAPRLAINYSSQGPTYGGVAVGWSLSIPEIREDTSQGRLRTHAPEVEAVQADPKADDRFVSSLAGGRPLVEVGEPKASTVYKTYRSRNDGSFARYERMLPASPGENRPRWRVFSPDGHVMLFGEPQRTSGCTNVDDGFAPLTSEVDPFGNLIRYTWGPTAFSPAECKIQQISWGANETPGANLADFASITFNYATPTQCSTNVDVGSSRDYRTGRLIVTGASKLTSIVATAYPPGAPQSPVHTRTITLGYSTADESCSATHAPMRFLTSIQETAVGTDSPQVTLPAVQFQYHDPTVNLVPPGGASGIPWTDEPINLPGGVTELARRSNLAWGRRYDDDRFPTVEAMVIDVDGDGLLDRVINASTPHLDGQCRAKWQRNLGPTTGSGGAVTFAAPVALATLPRLKWHNPTSGTSGNAVSTPAQLEGCSLNGQVTAFLNSTPASLCHDFSQPVYRASNNPGPYCDPGGTEPPTTSGPNPPDYRTYLVYRWQDVDSDGLVDLVAAVHGNINRYDPDQGNLVPFLGVPEGTFAWPACPAIDRCKKIDPVCASARRSCPVGQPCTFDWAEPDSMTSCITQASQAGCDSLINSPVTQQSGGNSPPPTTMPRHAYTRCDGLYPWFIYKNLGYQTVQGQPQLQFATTPTIKYQPVPLESDTGDSSILARGVMSQSHAVMDFDGDGILDAVARPRGSDDTVSFLWNVWLGDGTGGFGPQRYVFPTRNGPHNRISGFGLSWGALSASSEGLLDLNGDGLPDHWLTSDFMTLHNANIAFHDGTQHRLVGQASPAVPTGEVATPAASIHVKPGNDTVASEITPVPLLSQAIASGKSDTTNRVADVDGDGRVDVVANANTTPQVFFNLGGQFPASPVSLVGDATGFKRRVRAIDHGAPTTSQEDWTWQLETDLIDLDGNGVPESVTFPSATTIARAEHNPLAPPRLLWKVVNNRGAETTISYASMHDDAVVTRASGSPPSPANQWVVKSMTTLDRIPSDVSSTTSYLYKDPQFGPDDENRRAFRGFAEVTTTGPSGSKVVQRYGYAPDWSGRPTTTLVVPAEAPTNVRSMEKTTWEERQLFGGALRTYHATVVERFTCANGQTETTCTPSAAPGYTRTTSTLTALASTTQPGAPLLWQETSSLLQGGTSAADGDRETVSTFALKADVVTDATAFRLRPLVATRNHRVGGTMTMFGKAATTWDADFKVPLTSETWFDANDANRAIARSVYDMTTGNVVQRFKPKQNAAGTTSTTFTYDSRKLFATTMVNEVGHQLDYLFEYGTGTKLQTEGPNVRACTSGCPSGATYPVKEQHKVRVDGLGRPIEKWDTTSDDGHVYTLYLRETTTYVDAYVAPTPPSVTHQTRLDSAGPVWKQEKTELDGHGRPSRKIVFAQGSAPADHVTSFAYRPDGTLETVKVPDPTTNDATVVTYAYGFDSLGRPTSLRRPDAIPALDQSGVDIAYDGLTTTTTEVTGVAGGNIAMTITLKDRFGRLVEVHERTADATFAVTEYVHGPDDLVTTVIDPSNVTTTMQHDFAGRRTQITRPGNRTWKYTYDKNGNVIAEQVPGSPSPPVTDPDYTTTIAYDDLDRPASKVIGQRGLSVADQASFGSRTESFTWDAGGNHKGYLRYWQSFAPSSSTASVTLDVGNNNQGQRTLTEHRLNIAGYPQLIRQHLNYYWLFGGLRQTRFYDAVTAGGNATVANYAYDARFLPLLITLTRGGEPSLNIAQQTRNVAGLVTKRRTNTTGAMTFVESNWTYDKLGRVVDQVVQKGPGPTQITRQSLTYFGNDDPATLDHYLGTTQRHFVYGYDLRHQLTSAVETTTPGYYASSYHYGSPTSAGRFSRAVEAQTIAVTGSEVKPRDVTYFYNGADPEQVTHLRITNSNAAYATYTYDAVGNQTSRCLGPNTSPCTGELLEYVYDGKDQLRRVTKKVNGTITGSEEYWYQAEGNRVAIVKRDSAGAKTELVWFIGDTQAHYDPSGAITHVYSHPSLGTPVARVDRTSNTSTSLELQFHGLSSSTLATVGSNGTANTVLGYTPYGTTLEAFEGAAGMLDVHPRRHNDKFTDSLSQLRYYGFRYLDDIAIGWTQSDPAFRISQDVAGAEPRRASLYIANLHNPLRYLDPDGQNPAVVVQQAPRVAQAIVYNAPKVAEKIVTAVQSAPKVAQAARDGIATGLAVGTYVLSEAVDLISCIGGCVPLGEVVQPIEVTPYRTPPAPPEPEGYRMPTWPFGNPDMPRIGPVPVPGNPRGRDKYPRLWDEFWDDLVKRPPWEPDMGKAPRVPGPNPPPPFGSGSGSNSLLHGGCTRSITSSRVPRKFGAWHVGRGRHKPADGDGDGSVTDDEESAWMRSQR